MKKRQIKKNILLFGLFTFLQIFISLAWAGANQWTSTGVNQDAIIPLAVNPSNSSILYAIKNSSILYKSSDGGNNWNQSNTGMGQAVVATLIIDPSNTTILYAGTNSGVFKSSDGGTNWSPANSGLTSLTVAALVLDPTHTSTLYAGTEKGVFKSTDSGKNWNPINTGLSYTLPAPYNYLTVTNIGTLAIDPSNPAIIYAGTNYLAGVVFKTTNAGANWNLASNGLSGQSITALVIDPSNTSTLYVSEQLIGIFKSTDGGNNWNYTNSPPSLFPSVLVIDHVNTNILYLYATTDIYKSTNGGEVWRPTNSSLNGLNGLFLGLVIDPSNPNTLYAGTSPPYGGGGGGMFVFTNTPVAYTQTECLFNYAEKIYPSLFSPAGTPTIHYSNGNTLRYYPTTASYLYISPTNQHVFYQNQLNGQNTIQDLGALAALLPQIGCQAPPPIDCLFNWAENDYPNLLTPALVNNTQVFSPYTYRYYSTTNVYLGVSSTDNHVYFLAGGGNLQDLGLSSKWKSVANCQ